MNEPIEVRSRLVVYPYRLIEPKTDAVMKKTLVILSPVKAMNIQEIESPISAANTQNITWAFSNEKLINLGITKKIITSGANTTTHWSGVPNIALNNAGELETINATSPVIPRPTVM